MITGKDPKELWPASLKGLDLGQFSSSFLLHWNLDYSDNAAYCLPVGMYVGIHARLSSLIKSPASSAGLPGALLKARNCPGLV